MALVRYILGKFLGVVCHCFPPGLDVPTFATRCLHVQNGIWKLVTLLKFCDIRGIPFERSNHRSESLACDWFATTTRHRIQLFQSVWGRSQGFHNQRIHQTSVSSSFVYAAETEKFMEMMECVRDRTLYQNTATQPRARRKLNFKIFFKVQELGNKILVLKGLVWGW